MSDEVKETQEKQECNCFCHSKGFRKFVVIALGTFVGVYCALSLFAALHRPPMMPAPYHFQTNRPCPCQMMHHRHFEKMKQGDFRKFDRPAPQGPEERTPFEVQKH